MEQGPPASGAVWRLAICRANHNSGFGELSAWPVFRARDFHSSESYAPVTFE